MAEGWPQDRVRNSFAQLGPDFHAELAPRPLHEPRLLHANPQAAALVGLDPGFLASPGFLAVCAGQAPLPGGRTIATVYSGHQFGVWAGQLGDGRAHLLGEIDGPDGSYEIQLKGSGRTPYARMGDGRAVLRSSVREYLASEAMAGLGIPTTRALAIVCSDDPVYRETVETAAIVTRLSPTFLRFGHFEHWAGSHGHQKALLDYAVDRHFPWRRQGLARPDDTAALALAFLDEVLERTARLIARWQLVGFCHGVMNTDNMSILGLTIDYGPYGFMDRFVAGHVCNHSDTGGRYAWNAQPAVAHWNLYRLAGSLRVLGCDEDVLRERMRRFQPVFLQAFYAGLADKLGLGAWQPDDAGLGDAWWALLQQGGADFTLAFRYLADAPDEPSRFLSLFQDPDPAREWLAAYGERLARDATEAGERRARMLAVNPLYVLRNHLAQQAIEAAQRGDASVIDALLRLLRRPCQEQPGAGDYAMPPPQDAPQLAVSCSS